MIGKRLGDFEITGEIGKGGMGQVYKARQISLDRDVAIKVLPGNLSEVGEFRERFDVEAKAIASLVHENILQVYSKGVTEDGIHYFAMEFVDGEDLAEKIKRGVVFSEREAIDIAIQVCRGLEAAGARNIIHRDIKPSNIMITKKGVVKIADFGLAKSLDVTKKITQTNMYMGTVAYTSPEQGEGKRVDQRTDIYSLGVVLYQLLTGRVPFEGETPSSVIYKHVYEAPPPPRSMNPGLSPAAEEVVLKAIAKKPEDRYQNVTDFRNSLEAVISGPAGKTAQPSGAKQAAVLPAENQISSKEEVGAGTGRNNAPFLIIVTLIILLLGGSALYASKYGYRALFSKILPLSKTEEVKEPELPQQSATVTTPAQTELLPQSPEPAVGPAEDTGPAPGNITPAPEKPAQPGRKSRDMARYDRVHPSVPGDEVGREKQAKSRRHAGLPTVVVVSTGETNVADIVESAVAKKIKESSFPMRFGRRGIPLNALHQQQFKADIVLYIKINTMNASPLEFYGRTMEQYAAAISIRAIDISTRNVIIAPVSKTVHYTSLNMQDNVEEATTEMMADIPGRLEAFWRP